MKIVDVNEFYAEQGGGVRTYVNQKLRAGAERGHEVVIVAPGPEDGEEQRLGGRIVWIEGPPMPFDPKYTVLWREKRVHAILDREQPDVVEGSSPWSGGWFAARWPGRAAKTFIFHSDPVAAYAHTYLDRFAPPAGVDRLFTPYWAYLRALSRRFDATVAAGEWLVERLEGLGIKNPVAVPFGVDRTDVATVERDPALRRELLAACGHDEQALLLVGVGRLHPEKRWETVMRAVAEVGRDRPLGLVVYGKGPLAKPLEQLARELGHIVLGGRIAHDELARSLAASDYCVHGSAAETYGLAVAEALCVGLPALVPNRGGAAELVDAASGQHYEPGNAHDCTRALRRLLNRDRAALSAGVASAAERILDPSGHFDALFELYARLAAARP